MIKKNILLFFVRWPEPGKVKSRLAATLGTEEACRIHRHLAECCYNNARFAPNTRLIVSGTGAPPVSFQEWLPGADDYWEQPQTDLGERLRTFFFHAFEEGATTVAAIGSDCPTLKMPSLANAFQALQSHDVAALPATDGGYVWIGSSRYIPELFSSISWGTEKVMAETRINCSELDLSLWEGESFEDIDHEEEWLRYVKNNPEPLP
jgi:rSAM/selenodomain-associated transferase 1